MLLISTYAVFLGFMILACSRPRNERFTNSLVVLASGLLALWYEPAMPELLRPMHDETGAFHITWPIHRLLALPIMIGILYCTIILSEHWKQIRHRRHEDG